MYWYTERVLQTWHVPFDSTPVLPGFSFCDIVFYMKTIQPTILFFVWGPVPSAEDYEEVAALEEQGVRVKMRNAQWATPDAGIEEADGYRGAVPDHYKAYVEHLEYLASQPPVQEPEKTIELVDLISGGFVDIQNPLERAMADIPTGFVDVASVTAAQAKELLDVAVEPTPEPVVVVKKKMGRPRKQASAE